MCLFFPHREAENTIESTPLQVCNMTEEVVGWQYIVLILTDIAKKSHLIDSIFFILVFL